MKTILIFLLLTSCQYVTKHDEKRDSVVDLTDLKTKYDAIYQEVESDLDESTGWPSTQDCDSTLWAGISCVVGLPTQISLAEFSSGEIHRRPFKACYDDVSGDQGAKSTISRDMITSYMSCLWNRKDLAAFQRLANYGESHDWILGKPVHLVSRVLLTPNLIGLLGRSIFVLSERQDDRYYRRSGYLFPPVSADFERNIQVQTILLQDSIDGQYNLTSINSEMLDRLIENADAYPSDHLFAAALGRFTGDQSKALALLLAEEMTCPSYARGEKPEVYCKILWLQAAKILLGDV